MATNQSFGGLGGLTDDERSTLNTEVMGLNTNQAFGLDTAGKISLGAIGKNALSPALSNVMSFTSLGKGLMNANPDMLASKAMGKDYGFMGGVKSVTGFGRPSQSLADMMDTDKSGSVSQSELDSAYGIGMTGSGYGAGVDRSNPSSMTGIDVTTGKDVDQFGFSTNPYSYSDMDARGISQDTQTGIGRGVDTVGLGGAKGAGYTGSKGGVFGFGKAEGVDISDPESTGSTGVGVSNVDAMGNTATTGGISFSDDAQASGTGDDGGTYICTALYQMGDMKKYIYKYDQVYGKRVDEATYRGYVLWGKPLAKQIMKKGMVYKIVKPMALAWARQMAFDLSKGKHGTNNKTIKIIKTIGEGICYALGQIFRRRQIWQKSM